MWFPPLAGFALRMLDNKLFRNLSSIPPNSRAGVPYRPLVVTALSPRSIVDGGFRIDGVADSTNEKAAIVAGEDATAERN